jgi:hypothetical protein
MANITLKILAVKMQIHLWNNIEFIANNKYGVDINFQE